MTNMSSASYPIQWEPVTGDEAKEKLYKSNNPENFCAELDHVQWNGVRLPTKFLKFADRIYNMEVRPDDMWVVTYHKCGTTWTQVIRVCRLFQEEDTQVGTNVLFLGDHVAPCAWSG